MYCKRGRLTVLTYNYSLVALHDSTTWQIYLCWVLKLFTFVNELHFRGWFIHEEVYMEGKGEGEKTSKGEGMVEHLLQILAKPTSR